MTQQKPEAQNPLYLEGYLSTRARTEGSPTYGYPKNHVPPSTVDSLEFTTCFFAAAHR